MFYYGIVVPVDIAVEAFAKHLYGNEKSPVDTYLESLDATRENYIKVMADTPYGRVDRVCKLHWRVHDLSKNCFIGETLQNNEFYPLESLDQLKQFPDVKNIDSNLAKLGLDQFSTDFFLGGWSMSSTIAKSKLL